jgi:type II secretory ATPase GspE/PulE/Tfp pilus assembly ATPase PilB-like protein
MKHKADQTDVVALVDDILAQAIKSRASDIHFEPTSRSMTVKYRLDGELKVTEKLPKFISDNVVARLKVLAGLLTYRNDIPQEGRIQTHNADHSDSGRVTDKRLSIFPTIHGQRAVIRIFYENAGLTELDKLGFSEYILSALKKIASQNQGILLLTGPAGSGKSTTLAALLQYILQQFPGKSIVALEDPVERAISGVTQVQIEPRGEMTFPVALRSLLRQDPEVLMIGEIRDAATASIVIEAGLTGHLLMSTMHSGSPAGAILRMLEMGIEPYQVTSSVSAVLNQRLIRMLCADCKTHDNKTGTYKADGCESCLGTGYKGRRLIAEIVQIDGELRKAILAKTDLDELQNILTSRGHMTMAHDGQRLITEGLTTQQEITRVLGPVSE